MPCTWVQMRKILKWHFQCCKRGVHLGSPLSSAAEKTLPWSVKAVAIPGQTLWLPSTQNTTTVATAVLQSRVWGLPVFSTLESSGFKEAGGKLHEFTGIKNCGCVQNKNRVGLGVIKQDSDPDCLGSSWVSLHHLCLWWEGHCPLDTLPFWHLLHHYSFITVCVL